MTSTIFVTSSTTDAQLSTKDNRPPCCVCTTFSSEAHQDGRVSQPTSPDIQGFAIVGLAVEQPFDCLSRVQASQRHGLSNDRQARLRYTMTRSTLRVSWAGGSTEDVNLHVRRARCSGLNKQTYRLWRCGHDWPLACAAKAFRSICLAPLPVRHLSFTASTKSPLGRSTSGTYRAPRRTVPAPSGILSTLPEGIGCTPGASIGKYCGGGA